MMRISYEFMIIYTHKILVYSHDFPFDHHLIMFNHHLITMNHHKTHGFWAMNHASPAPERPQVKGADPNYIHVRAMEHVMAQSVEVLDRNVRITLCKITLG